MTLHVQNEVTFNVFKAMKYPSNNDECYYINIVDKVTTKIFVKENPTLPLEACIVHSDTITKENFEGSVQTIWKQQHHYRNMGSN